jgi:hypothetical protein
MVGFLSECEGFFIELCSWLPNKDFLRILRQGTRVCAYSARVRVPEYVQNSKGSHAQIKGNHHKTNAEDEVPTSLVQTNQKAFLAQTGDEWNRQWRRRGCRGAR